MTSRKPANPKVAPRKAPSEVRLLELVPEEVGRLAAQRGLQVLLELGPLMGLQKVGEQVSDDLASTPLGKLAKDLCIYAQTGKGMKTEQAEKVMTQLFAQLYAARGEDGLKEMWSLGNRTPDPVIRVLVGAQGRIRLERGEDLTRSQLAALSNIDDRSLAYHIKLNGLAPKSHGLFSHADAKAWLQKRPT